MADEDRQGGAERDEHGRDLSHVPENLRGHVFKPGQSGNPKGRPKGRTLVEIINDVLAEEVRIGDGDSVSRMEAAVRIAADEAIRNRDVRWFRELMDRISPKPKRIEVSNVDESEPTAIVLPSWGPAADDSNVETDDETDDEGGES